MSGMRPARLTGLALLALGGAAAALAVAQVGLAPVDAGPLTAVARTLRGDLQARLKTQLEALTDASRAAATLPRLKAALAAKVDAPTMVDLFTSENWWRPFREEFPINRMVTGREIATHGTFGQRRRGSPADPDRAPAGVLGGGAGGEGQALPGHRRPRGAGVRRRRPGRSCWPGRPTRAGWSRWPPRCRRG